MRALWLAALLAALFSGVTGRAAAAERRADTSKLAPGLLQKAAPALKRIPREVTIELTVLHATREKQPVDPNVGDVPELREPPFSKYASYRLLQRNKLKLTMGVKNQLLLPNRDLLETRLLEQLPDTSLRLRASIKRPGARDPLPLLDVQGRAGQAFIVAGQSYHRGILVLVFKVL
jgi:hypothetical protein